MLFSAHQQQAGSGHSLEICSGLKMSAPEDEKEASEGEAQEPKREVLQVKRHAKYFVRVLNVLPNFVSNLDSNRYRELAMSCFTSQPLAYSQNDSGLLCTVWTGPPGSFG